jgi:hypothetical protein
MKCPLCGRRKARRDCPALRQSICSVCCGTKRLKEIACPESCVHLSASRAHPPAVVVRQQNRDAATLLPTIRHLSERQQELFLLFHTVIAAHRPEGFARLVDADVADAAGACAATLETAARGVIYEHAATSVPAQALARELQATIDEIRAKKATLSDTEAAGALRAIEAGARDGHKGDATEAAYVDLMRRLLQASGLGGASGPGGTASREDLAAPPGLILPPT